ncbi:UBP-type zinc finger domain-containing protein [Maribacter sp. 2-571]|uniref:UBP-type zinc finger domain-containing protein n=1 Tax=Maribacter sp. 2-571 TaxID=3417569 RepID=UPI003D347855
MALKNKTCEHLNTFEPEHKMAPKGYECEECIKTGDQWVHLRTCQQCGTTLCCDSSTNKHASTHARTYAHPTVISVEPNENWAWCYEHRTFLRF